MDNNRQIGGSPKTPGDIRGLAGWLLLWACVLSMAGVGQAADRPGKQTPQQPSDEAADNPSASTEEKPGANKPGEKEKEKKENKPANIAPAARQEIDLHLPKGAKPKAGHGESLLIRDKKGKAIVGRLHCDVGDERLVMLPSGGLTVVKKAETRTTDKPFVGATAESIRKSLEEAKLTGFKTVAAEPYLFLYASSEAFYLHTRSIIESIYPGVKSRLEEWGLKVEDPVVPLVVIILPNRATFHAFRQMPKDVLAYYDMLTNYVVLYEDPELAWAAPELHLKQAAYTIAHEAVHQIMGNVGVQQRLSNWPMWICEGLPEYFCPISVNSKIVKTKSGELPARTLKWTRAGMINDLRMYSLMQIPPSDGRIVEGLVRARQLDGNGYAVGWGLVHYLATTQKKKFQLYMQDVARLLPLEEQKKASPRDPDPLFVKHFGEAFPLVERSVQKHLTSDAMQKEYRDPLLYQTHYVIKSITKKGKSFETRVMITTSPDAAERWKGKEVARAGKGPGSQTKFYSSAFKTGEQAAAEALKFGKR